MKKNIFYIFDNRYNKLYASISVDFFSRLMEINFYVSNRKAIKYKFEKHDSVEIKKGLFLDVNEYSFSLTGGNNRYTIIEGKDKNSIVDNYSCSCSIDGSDVKKIIVDIKYRYSSYDDLHMVGPYLVVIRDDKWDLYIGDHMFTNMSLDNSININFFKFSIVNGDLEVRHDNGLLGLRFSDPTSGYVFTYKDGDVDCEHSFYQHIDKTKLSEYRHSYFGVIPKDIIPNARLLIKHIITNFLDRNEDNNNSLALKIYDCYYNEKTKKYTLSFYDRSKATNISGGGFYYNLEISYFVVEKDDLGDVLLREIDDIGNDNELVFSIKNELGNSISYTNYMNGIRMFIFNDHYTVFSDRSPDGHYFNMKDGMIVSLKDVFEIVKSYLN